MSLEARVTTLENKVEMFEHVFEENIKILEATHKVIVLVLNEQRQEFRKIDEQFVRINARFDQQEAFNRQVNENFKQLETLITQLHPRH